MNTKDPRSVRDIAALFGVPEERVREQFRRNAAQLDRMADRAGGGKVNGFTRAQLTAYAESARRKADE